VASEIKEIDNEEEEVEQDGNDFIDLNDQDGVEPVEELKNDSEHFDLEEDPVIVPNQK
jgi:hypothetical protein